MRLKDALEIPLSYGLNEPAVEDNPKLPRYIRITDFDDNDSLRTDTFKSISIEKIGNCWLKNGDILLARSGATVGKAFYFASDIKACYAGYLIRARFDKNKVIPRYFSFITKSTLYSDWKNRVNIQSTIQNISAEKYNLFDFPTPSVSEQSCIISYLDTKTAAIDKRIEVLEKKQEVYSRLRKSIINRAVTRGLNPNVPLKDSGVDWIGMIPEHWEVRRMKESILSLESGKRPANDKEEVLSIGGEHIQNGNFSLNHPMYVSEQTYMNSQGKIKLGDTLIVKDGATIGKCMYVSEMPSDRMLLNEHVYRVEGEKYLYWLITSSHSQYWFRSMNMSSAQESIKQITMQNLPVPLPPLPEQRAIADYLDEKCAKIDAAVENISKQIDALKRLKRALINEVVTGKRKV